MDESKGAVFTIDFSTTVCYKKCVEWTQSLESSNLLHIVPTKSCCYLFFFVDLEDYTLISLHGSPQGMNLAVLIAQQRLVVYGDARITRTGCGVDLIRIETVFRVITAT